MQDMRELQEASEEISGIDRCSLAEFYNFKIPQVPAGKAVVAFLKLLGSYTSDYMPYDDHFGDPERPVRMKNVRGS